MPAKKSTSPKAPSRASLAEYHRKRDFKETAEPRGGKATSTPQLGFVVQKHAATRLHFDFRLELDGVMKSWAVPKGPSMDPADKRLAMEVEDHPIEYNSFEGTIPRGQYGGGTVMIWDQGIYTYGNDDVDPVEGLRRGYAKGDLKVVLLGERLKGSFVLVRMKGGKGNKNEWLLIKHKDEFAEPGIDVVKSFGTSVVSGRTMEKIARGDSAVWNSNARRGA
ncbi:MAG: DNA polymerase ligase N-terminal domain-containing protein [Gemmatimonadota bacterium]